MSAGSEPNTAATHCNSFVAFCARVSQMDHASNTGTIEEEHSNDPRRIDPAAFEKAARQELPPGAPSPTQTRASRRWGLPLAYAS